jgi:hypothetical protein
MKEISNRNGVRAVKFATSTNFIINSTMFPHCNIHKHTFTSPDGKMHHQIDHILNNKRWHSNVVDVQYFIQADCDTEHYLVVAERQRLSVSK